MSDLFSIDALSKSGFYIDDFYVDCQRGIISLEGVEHAIEPKVMAVLLHLAARAGHVVEPEPLFATVWPKSIYSPGSIRRCITVLRKVFRDDAKTLVATHPKRGYSLNAKIRLVESPSLPLNTKRLVVGSAVAAFFTLLCFIALNQWRAEIAVPNITRSLPITSTEQLEDFAAISPDGKYLAFVRSPVENHKAGHLWIKDLTDDKEYQLSKSPVYARNLSWHKDSKALLYVAVKEPGLDIIRVSLGKTVGQSSESVVLSRPALNWISRVVWGPNNKLYYIALDNGKKSLFINDLTTGKQQLLFKSSDLFSPFDLAMSNNAQQLALIGWHQGVNSQIKFLSIEHLQKHQMRVVDELTLDGKSYGISWHPSDKSLLLNDGRQLYHLSLSGDINRIEFENYHFIRFAHFSPDADTIAIVVEKLDLDIWQASLQFEQPAKLAFDSNSMDREAKLSPTGDRFVFITESKGYPQIMIHHLSSGENQLIFDNPQQHLYVSPPKWHPLGEKVAFAVNAQPIIVDLTNGTRVIERLKDIRGVPLQWYQQEQSLLLAVFDQAAPVLVKFDLALQQSTKLANRNGTDAYLNGNDELIFISKQGIDKPVAPDSLENLHRFDGVVLRHYRTAQGIYLYVKAQQQFSLWFYSFANQSTVKIKQWSVDQRIVDVDNSGQFMLTDTVKIEKDIVFLLGE
ncbi:MAG: winged helix-turn-helix domain-containing protein [Psychrosphaera sp.]|nr:winged helix-turn-helix domain-containing protein [Psychrosphaera sp.]